MLSRISAYSSLVYRGKSFSFSASLMQVTYGKWLWRYSINFFWVKRVIPGISKLFRPIYHWNNRSSNLLHKISFSWVHFSWWHSFLSTKAMKFLKSPMMLKLFIFFFLKVLLEFNTIIFLCKVHYNFVLSSAMAFSLARSYYAEFSYKVSRNSYNLFFYTFSFSNLSFSSSIA